MNKTKEFIMRQIHEQIITLCYGKYIECNLLRNFAQRKRQVGNINLKSDVVSNAFLEVAS